MGEIDQAPIFVSGQNCLDTDALVHPQGGLEPELQALNRSQVRL
jgi:hypothetical protein